MKNNYRPAGIYSAQWIPTDRAGRLIRPALTEHIAFERGAGISGLLALGSTGEFPQFLPDERKAVLAAVVELARPLPVMANVTDLRPRVAVELGRFAKSLGCPAIALMPPAFYPVSQADVLAYFRYVAEAVDLPVMLYNFPELTGKRIDLPTVAAFADTGAMCAIKQSGREFDYHSDLIRLGREKGFVVMTGADTRLPEVFALGAAGCTGGLVNIVPEWMVHLHRVCAVGAPGESRAIAARMQDLGRIIDQLTFPLNVAAGLEARGFDPGSPKMIVSTESAELYCHIVAELRDLFTAARLACPPEPDGNSQPLPVAAGVRSHTSCAPPPPR